MAKPSKLTNISFAIAAAAPEKRTGSAYEARVPWHLIDELREELDQLGYDWKGGIVRRKEREKKARARMDERRAAQTAHAQAWRDVHHDDVCGNCGHPRETHAAEKGECGLNIAGPGRYKICGCPVFVGPVYEPVA